MLSLIFTRSWHGSHRVETEAQRSLSYLSRFPQPVGDRTSISVSSFLSPVTTLCFLFPTRFLFLSASLIPHPQLLPWKLLAQAPVEKSTRVSQEFSSTLSALSVCRRHLPPRPPRSQTVVSLWNWTLSNLQYWRDETSQEWESCSGARTGLALILHLGRGNEICE